MSHRAAFLAVLASLVCGVALADPYDTCGRAFWSVPTVAGTPVPAALLPGGSGWPEASAFTGLTCLAAERLSRSQPVFWLARDAEALLVGWRVPRLGKAPFRKEARQRDGQVWTDDAIEVFLDPGHTHGDYVQLMVNAAGARADAHGRDLAWDAEWTAAVAENGEAWAGAMRVPFASLGVTAPGEGAVWAANFGVDRSPAQQPQAGWDREETNLTWARLGSGSTYHEPVNFGHLIFAPEAVQLTHLGAPWWRSLDLRGQSAAASTVELGDGKGTGPWSADVPAGPLQVRRGDLEPGDYTFAFTSQAKGRKVAFLYSRFRAAPVLEARLDTLTLRQALDVSALLDAPDVPATDDVHAALLDGQGREVRLGTPLTEGGVTRVPVRWGFGDLPAADYRLVLRSATRPEARTEVTWRLPARPAWLGSSAGKYGDSHVPQPWSPLRILSQHPLKVACWGREYAFGPAGLFGSVRARGKELLAGPVTLTAKARGKTLAWRPSRTRVTKVAAGAVEFKTEQTGGGVRVACQGRMEFDGFVKLRLRVSGTERGAELQGLTLAIPFRKEAARLLHNFPRPSVWVAVNMKQFNARAVPTQDWASPFLYHVWLGDEEKGLQWLCETDEQWRPADPNRALELVHTERATVLRLNLIGRPTKLDRPREYVFAFQASPVKPMPKDYRHWRYAQVAGYGIESAPYQPPGEDKSIVYPAAGNLDPRRGTLEVTVTPTFDSTAPGETNRGLFHLQWPADQRPEPEKGAWLYWNQDDRGPRAVQREGHAYRLVMGGRFAWRPGETHTVALTWGEESGIYVDRQRIADLPDQPLFAAPPDLSEAIIRLGGMDSDFIVRQVRISDAPRPVEELGFGDQPLTADGQTLLLDRFDDVTGEEGARASRPERIAGGGTGRVSDAVVQVAGGFDLSRKPFRGTYLDYFAELGLKTLGNHEQWAELQGFPRTEKTKELRSMIEGSHAKGFRVILYHSWQLADTAPEYPLYLRECEVIDPNRFIYTREPKQKDYPICARSVWADFLADGMQKLFRDFGADGIYSDGLSYPSECSNALHGCGYVGEDGKRHPTMPIFAAREAMKRFSHLLEQQGKRTLFVCHTSGAITLPTLAFCDAYLDGEHLCGQSRPFKIPLDTFRAEFMGHNYGLPAYFLAYDGGRGLSTEEALALSLLHDTEVPWSYTAMAPVYRAWEEFGVEEARFEGYWGPRPWLRTAPEGVEVSAYLKPGREMLLVLVNVTDDPVPGTVALRDRIAEARDARTGKPIPLADGALAGPFAPGRLYLIRTKSAR